LSRRIGATWLTLLLSKELLYSGRDLRSVDLSIHAGAPGEVDALYQGYIAPGSRKGRRSFKTEIHEKMQSSHVEDPFGVRSDII